MRDLFIFLRINRWVCLSSDLKFEKSRSEGKMNSDIFGHRSKGTITTNVGSLYEILVAL